MAVRQETFFIAYCDICGADCDQAGDVWLWDTTRALAVQQAADTPGWKQVEGGLVCPVADAAHDKARGGDSPLLPGSSRDAMTVTFEADGVPDQHPTDEEMRRFLADRNARRLGWGLFQKSTLHTALRMLRDTG
jgi:hypothetical protein